jgi:hypothetical protein
MMVFLGSVRSAWSSERLESPRRARYALPLGHSPNGERETISAATASTTEA